MAQIVDLLTGTKGEADTRTEDRTRTVVEGEIMAMAVEGATEGPDQGMMDMGLEVEMGDTQEEAETQDMG